MRRGHPVPSERCARDPDQMGVRDAPGRAEVEAADPFDCEAGGLGRVLVDSQDRTVYLFEKDTGPKSTCFGASATEWPPVTTSGKPSAGSGVTASMFGTTKRSDGKTQVTYNGHPLYLFEADRKPGDATGQNVDAFGAAWYVLSPAGNKVAGKATGSGGGYAY